MIGTPDRFASIASAGKYGSNRVCSRAMSEWTRMVSSSSYGFHFLVEVEHRTRERHA